MARRNWSVDATPEEFMRVVGILSARRAALFRAATVLQSEWKEVLGSPGRGKVYEPGVAFITTKGSPRRVIAVHGSAKAPSRKTRHQASAPGQPPAPDTGKMRGAVAIDYEMAGGASGGGESDRVRVGFVNDATGRIALALEYGVNVSGTKVARHPAANFKIDPRPHARPAMQLALPKLTGAVVREFKAGT